MLFFADSAESVVVQGTMMGGIAVVVTSMLLLLWFLDNPYQSSIGGLNRRRWSGRSSSWTRARRPSASQPAVLCDEKGVAS